MINPGVIPRTAKGHWEIIRSLNKIGTFAYSDPHRRQKLDLEDSHEKNADQQLDLDPLKINADPLLSMRITNANFVSVTVFVSTNKDVEHSNMGRRRRKNISE